MKRLLAEAPNYNVLAVSCRDTGCFELDQLKKDNKRRLSIMKYDLDVDDSASQIMNTIGSKKLDRVDLLLNITDIQCKEIVEKEKWTPVIATITSRIQVYI